jgi:hypothetical protein
MTQSMHRRATVGGNERDVFSKASRVPGRRTNATVKRKALQRERRATRQELRQMAA